MFFVWAVHYCPRKALAADVAGVGRMFHKLHHGNLQSVDEHC